MRFPIRTGSWLWRGILSLLLAGIIGGVFFWLTQSSVLAIEDIQVDGNQAVATEQILDRVGPVLKGRSILSPSFNDAVRTIKEFPYVESVDLEKDYPHTLIIHVHEYHPLASLQLDGGRGLLLAADGRVLDSQDKIDHKYPIISTKDQCPTVVGQTVSCPDAQAAVRFLADVPVNFNAGFTGVSVNGGDISATTGNGVNVHFGTLDDYGLKFVVLRQLMVRSMVQGAQLTIDVSVPDRPVTR